MLEGGKQRDVTGGKQESSRILDMVLGRPSSQDGGPAGSSAARPRWMHRSRMDEDLFVTLFLAPFSTVVVLLTELLDPAAGFQHHHLRHCDDHSEEIWILKTLQK